jgi:hypothetical protein
VIRLFYIALAGVLTFTPLMFVWAAERPRPATTGVGSRSTYYGAPVYYSGRGGWLGNSYKWGNGGGSDASVGGSSSFRGGGPGGGGK